jgi:hypothetical protein
VKVKRMAADFQIGNAIFLTVRLLRMWRAAPTSMAVQANLPHRHFLSIAGTAISLPVSVGG